MLDYQVIARRFRPQIFKDVIGQVAIVTTLKNGIKSKRLAQAYLFCGSRGTGKTTLARIFAKALNCQQPSEDFEPCNQCSSCREITLGSSLDVLEIDGASYRGIENIRDITETVGYASASGHFKIIIIDEVHMLTKEAFNALLKTLEEPPSKVKFFFATTEPHKVPSTILSRCQRFNLCRIPVHKIVAKLQQISKTLEVEVEDEALQIIAQQAEGGLRDAESLFDQILAFADGKITLEIVHSIFGLMAKDVYFELDRAGKQADLAKAFEIAHQVFSQGKDLFYFIDGFIEHFRRLLLIKISSKELDHLPDKSRYEQSASFYTKEQCLDLIDYLLEAQSKLRLASSSKTALEAILLHVLRSHFRLSIEVLVRRLSELEQCLNDSTKQVVKTLEKEEPVPTFSSFPALSNSPVSSPSIPSKVTPSSPLSVSKTTNPKPLVSKQTMSEDPTPTLADLSTKKTTIPKPVPIKLSQPAHRYDTLFHFAAVELNGRIQRN
jgi:DNA polymerase-3 subunit gamma/tau